MEAHYAERSSAEAVHHYGSWQRDGEVSASWLAWLASAPWLSTLEPRLAPAAPRELTVLTEASVDIEGHDPATYVREIESEYVDSPVVSALGVQGRPFASSIVDRLEEMRKIEAASGMVDQTWADRCYAALSSYVPGGRYEEQSDLTPRQIQSAFRARKGAGLIRVEGGRWLPPPAVRCDPYLDHSLPRVSPAAGPLWDLLGVREPTAVDCVAVMKRLAKRDEPNRSSEIRTFRHLLDLHAKRPLQKAVISDLPLRTFSGWKLDRQKPIYAVANPGLAEALGRTWTVWNPPLPLAELAPLLRTVNIDALEESRFEPEIPSHLAAGATDLQAEYVDAVGHLRDYLAINHPGLHRRLSSSQWAEVERAQVIVGAAWGIRASAPKRRPVRLKVRAHLFRDPLRLCLADGEEIAAADAGGQALASYFVGDDPAPEDRSTLALAWAYAFVARERERQQIELEVPGEPEDAPAPTPEVLRALKRKGRSRRITRTKTDRVKQELPPRELVELDDELLRDVDATFLQAKRRGKLTAARGTKLKAPKGRKAQRSDASRPVRAGQRHYTDRDREDVAYALVEAVLASSHALELEDIRDQGGAGADAVDREKDIWIEIKAHGQEIDDNVRFESSEAERADEKRGTIGWSLYGISRSRGDRRLPSFLIRCGVSTPIWGRGLKLTGIRQLAEQSK